MADEIIITRNCDDHGNLNVWLFSGQLDAHNLVTRAAYPGVHTLDVVITGDGSRLLTSFAFRERICALNGYS